MTLDLKLNPLADRAAEQPEESSSIQNDEALMERAFAEFLRLDKGKLVDDDLLDNTISSNGLTLDPREISLLMKRILGTGDRHLVDSITTGYYLTRLIQRSYDSGHNKFRLDSEGYSIWDIGRNLKGRRPRPLELEYTGKYAASFGCAARHARFTVYGYAGPDAGIHLKRSEFRVYGEACDFFAYYSRDSRFQIEGFITSLGWKIHNCSFDTHLPATYERMIDKTLWDRGCRNNKVRLLGADNKLIEQRVINT